MTDETPPDDTPLTFAAYATRIGKSRPYVSSLKAKGILHGPAFTADNKIIPSIADAQRAEAAHPGRGRNGAPADDALPTTATGAYARERTALIAAQRERAEMENLARRAELLPRTAIAAVIPPAARRYRDTIAQAVRDRISSDTERAALAGAIADATEQFITDVLDGGALQAPA